MPTEIHPTTVRLTDAQRADLDRIAAAWGGDVRPLSRQQTVAEMIRRAAAGLTAPSQTTHRNRSRRTDR